MKYNIKFLRKVSGDFVYSMAGILLFNAILQLIVYPMLEMSIGTSAFGVVLTLLSVVSILASSFGSAANYSRMLAHANYQTQNGDYNRFLTCACVLSAIVGVVSLIVFNVFSIWMALGIVILLVVSIYRYYADVPFRMEMDYKGYFLYYVTLAAGYLVGAFLFRGKNSWVYAFSIGEASALLFAFFKTGVFRKPYFEKGEHFSESFKAMASLSAANILSSLILNTDRILINLMIGPEMVTVFYTATLMGKTISMVGTPLNSVLIGYLTKAKITRKHIGVAGLISCAVTIFASAACWLASVIMIRFLYPSVYEAAAPLFMIGNASQIFFFISNSLMVFVMCLSGEKMSLYISIFHIVLYMIFVIPAGMLFGIRGILVALLLVNFIKFISVMTMAWKKAD